MYKTNIIVNYAVIILMVHTYAIHAMEQTEKRPQRASAQAAKKKITQFVHAHNASDSSSLDSSDLEYEPDNIVKRKYHKVADTVESQECTAVEKRSRKYIFICSVPACGKSCMSENALRDHVAWHKGGHQCPVDGCTIKIKSNSALLDHLQSIHGKGYQCPVCKIHYTCGQSLRLHLLDSHQWVAERVKKFLLNITKKWRGLGLKKQQETPSQQLINFFRVARKIKPEEIDFLENILEEQTAQSNKNTIELNSEVRLN